MLTIKYTCSTRPWLGRYPHVVAVGVDTDSIGFDELGDLFAQIRERVARGREWLDSSCRDWDIHPQVGFIGNCVRFANKSDAMMYKLIVS